jgi:hypothetical protein
MGIPFFEMPQIVFSVIPGGGGVQGKIKLQENFFF